MYLSADHPAACASMSRICHTAAITGHHLLGCSARFLRVRHADHAWEEGASVIPGVGGPVRVTLLQELVATLLCLIGHVGQPGRLAGEQLLPDEPVVDRV